MKRFAAENPAVVAIPDVVGVAVVGIEPQNAVVTLDVEDVQIAVGVRNVLNITSCHRSLIAKWQILELNFILGRLTH